MEGEREREEGVEMEGEREGGVEMEGERGVEMERVNPPPMKSVMFPMSRD